MLSYDWDGGYMSVHVCRNSLKYMLQICAFIVFKLYLKKPD